MLLIKVKGTLKIHLKHPTKIDIACWNPSYSGEGHVPFYVNVNHENGNLQNNWIDSLGAFFPGLLTLSGDIEEAVCLHFLYFTIWRMFDAMPERFNRKMLQPEVLFYPLRPELIESTYHLYRKDKQNDNQQIPE